MFWWYFSHFETSKVTWKELRGNTFCCLYLSGRGLLGVCRRGAVVAVCFWPHRAICSNDVQASIKVGTPHGSWGPLGSGVVALVRFFPPHRLRLGHSNEKQNLKKSKNKTTKTPPSSTDIQSVFSQPALLLLGCIKNKDCFNGAVQTHWAAFIQFHIFLFPRLHTHAQHTPVWRISADSAHVWIDMLQLTGPLQDRGRNYWFFANIVACWSWGHIHFHHSNAGGENTKVSFLFC